MRQKLGQHFLINPDVPGKMVAALEISEGDTILEVGPGHGELTQAIVAKIRADNMKDVKIVAVEKDAALAEGVRQRFKECPFLRVAEGDILEFLVNPARKKSLGKNYKIIGNLPYYLTGHLLRIIGEIERKPILSMFMVQKEVGDRMAAKPPRMNRLAASVQFWAEPKILFYVSRDEFDPPPEVNSVVILLRPKTKTSEKDISILYYKTIGQIFAQPRKTILNNITDKDAGKKEKERVRGILKEISIRPGSRPQDLDIGKIIELSRRISMGP